LETLARNKSYVELLSFPNGIGFIKNPNENLALKEETCYFGGVLQHIPVHMYCNEI
jgi:hypothetical protein